MRDASRWVPAACAVVALVVGLSTLNALPVGGFYDDSFYVILAKSLATGQGYRNLHLPGAPFAAHYPPGYPAFLALLWKLGPAFPANLMLFKAANAVLLAVVAWSTATFAMRRLQLAPWLAAVAALLGTITIPPLLLANMLLSETLFLALLVPALAYAEGALQEGGPVRMRAAVALGVLAAAITLVRSIGALVIVAIAVAYLWRRAWRAGAAFVATVLVMLAPWTLWTMRHGADLPPALLGAHGSYLGWFTGGMRSDGPAVLVRTALVNVTAMVNGVLPSFRVGPALLPSAVALIALLSLWAAAAWRTRSRVPVTLVFLALYLGLVVVWPGAPLRFVWGVWPLLMALLVAPIGAPATRGSTRAVCIVAAVCLAPGVLRYNVQGYRGGWWASISRQMGGAMRPAIVWARTHTAPGDVIASESEGMMYLYADRPSVPVTTFTAAQYLQERTPQENAGILRDILAAYHPRYVILQSPPDIAAARLLTAGPSAALVAVDTTGGVFAFAPVAGALPAP